MADYKRIVSYIYQYNQQVKGNNIGFTRIETRNGQCKIIVHVRVPNLQDVTMNVYAYCWYDGVIHGVPLGSMSIIGGIGEFKILTEADNVCHSQYRLADMGGILVYESEAMFLGTEWDDHAIHFRKLEVDTVKPEDFEERRTRRGETLMPASKREERKNFVREPDDEGIEEESQDTISLYAAEVVPVEQEIASADVMDETAETESIENTSLAEEVFVNESVEEEPILVAKSQPLSQERMEQLDQKAEELFGSMLTNAMVKSEQEEEEVPEPSLVVNPKEAITFFTTFKSCESENEYEEVLQEIQSLHKRISQLERVCKEWKMKEARRKEERQARWEAEQEKRQQEEEIRRNFDLKVAEDTGEDEVESQEIYADKEEENEIPPVVQRILSRYPVIDPFVDLEEGSCVRIEPQDIGIFPMENWVLANNSFLLHGYYTYRHLIFFYKRVSGRPVYLIGIPGVNHSRERYMANMFGFARFQPLTKVAEEHGVKAAGNSMRGNPAYDEELGGEFGYWCMEIRF